MKKKVAIQDVGKTILSIVEKISVDVTELKQRTRALEKGQEMILDTLMPLSRAHDKDAETIVDHERRIERLEKRVAVSR